MQDALINLTGNVGAEVEVSQGPGWMLARFRLACTPRRIRQGTWVDQETTWITVNCWGRLAENVAASLAKGDPVVVVGRLRTSAWNGTDGVRHERLVVEAVGLGHDLSRGRSSFQRVRSLPEQAAGERIDPATGEVIDASPRSCDGEPGPTTQEGDAVTGGCWDAAPPVELPEAV